MQQITPIEIRQKSFGKSFRGYKTDEVDAFLYSLAHTWERLIVQFSEVSDALDGSSKEVKRLQGVENAIMKALDNSENTARHIIEQAKKEAALKLRGAEFEVEKMFQAAKGKAKAIEEDDIKSRQIAKKQMARELEATQRIVQETEKYQDALLQKLQHLAEDILTKGKALRDSTHARPSIEESLQEEPQASDKSFLLSGKEEPNASSFKPTPAHSAEYSTSSIDKTLLR